MNNKGISYPKIMDISVLQSPSSKREQFPILLSLYPRIKEPSKNGGLTISIFREILKEIKLLVNTSEGAAKCECDGLITNVYIKDVNIDDMFNSILDKILKSDYQINTLNNSDYYIAMAKHYCNKNTP